MPCWRYLNFEARLRDNHWWPEACFMLDFSAGGWLKGPWTIWVYIHDMEEKSQSNQKTWIIIDFCCQKSNACKKTLAWFVWKKDQSKQRQSNMWPVWLLCLPGGSSYLPGGSRESPKSSSFRGKSMFCGHSRKDFRYLWSIFTLHIYMYIYIYILYTWYIHICLGAPKRKRRNARSGSHDTIAGPERNWKGWCFGVMINTNAFTGPRKTHPQVGQYVFPIFHCKGVGCVYISSENAFDKSALLVDRNKLKQYQNWMKTSLGWSSYWAPG